MPARKTRKKGCRGTARRSSFRTAGKARKLKQPKGLAARARRIRRRSTGPQRQALAARLTGQERFVDPKAVQQLKLYEAGVKYFQKQKFDRAKKFLEKALTGPSKELAERSQIHLNVCRQKLTRLTVQLKSADDHYYFAISMINMGRHDEAREHLLRARRKAPKADFVHYALATLAALAADPEGALEHLSQAIQLRPENRFHARYDEDFKLLQEDPRFTELIYPERELPT